MNDYDDSVVHSYLEDYYMDELDYEDEVWIDVDDTTSQPASSKTLESIFVTVDSVAILSEINAHGWKLEEEEPVTTARKALTNVQNMVATLGLGEVSKREAARIMMVEAARHLSKFEIFPEEDPCEDLEVLYFVRKYKNQPQEEYHYAAIRVEGKYYVTGSNSNPQGYTWSQLVDWMVGFVTEVVVMTTGRRIVPPKTSTYEATLPKEDETESKPVEVKKTPNVWKEQEAPLRAVWDNTQA